MTIKSALHPTITNTKNKALWVNPQLKTVTSLCPLEMQPSGYVTDCLHIRGICKLVCYITHVQKQILLLA